MRYDDYRKGENPFFSSLWDENGLRYRILSLRMDQDRLAMHDLPIADNGKYYDYIYTVDQAIERGIEFRENWRDFHPDRERIRMGGNTILQLNDWCITEIPEPDGDYWVMRCLWRNVAKTFPYARFLSGAFKTTDKKPLHAVDRKKGSTHGNMYGGERNLTARQERIALMIYERIRTTGKYNINIVKDAMRAVGDYGTNRDARMVMSSTKMQSRVAMHLKDFLSDSGLDHEFIAKQLKQMASEDYDKDPERRLNVIKMLMVGTKLVDPKSASLNPDLVLSDQPQQLPKGDDVIDTRAEDAEILEDLKEV